jgi:hypothetical protein
MGVETDKVLLSNEDYSRQRDPVDDQIVASSRTGEGCVELTPEMLEDLVKQAEISYRLFASKARQILTRERALFVKQCRVEQNCTWRKVAHLCHDEWKEDWEPPSNQIVGIVLCQQAMEMLGEIWPGEVSF